MARIATRIAKNDIQARSLAMLMYLQNAVFQLFIMVKNSA
jgi:alpha-glucosidase